MEREIRTDERSGVLYPENLARYGARWFEPDAAVAAVVESLWSVRWNFNPGESITQRIIATPGVTLTIEAGDVPGPLIVTGVHRRAWERDITGSGTVFGIRLRPAGLAVVSDLSPERIADATLPVTPDLDPRLFELLRRIAVATTPHAHADAANAVLPELLAERPVPAPHRLANAVVAALTPGGAPVDGPTLARGFGVSERTIQRALRGTLGQGPKWVGRWVRLQEVARLLSAPDPPDVAAVAVSLGYTDQAHLVNDFRTAVGLTPGAYVRSLRRLQGG
ncbi:helix-turn-helix domain-containing protein [Pengzhenrongella phosphoraccumulans]|uniref:helix-turn-helix domain-containing protein n=1 Tax=Pengzhenrongella phosphoraccumulans TaxID=3114394 RepID=UPI00388DF412